MATDIFGNEIEFVFIDDENGRRWEIKPIEYLQYKIPEGAMVLQESTVENTLKYVAE